MSGTVLDSGLLGLVLIARFHQLAVEPAQLVHDFGRGEPFSTTDLLLAARRLGLKAKAITPALDRLAQQPLPALARMADGRYVIVARVQEGEAGAQLLCQEAGQPQPVLLPLADFAADWSGELLLFTTRASLIGDLARFDWSWFLPAIVKYRRLLGEVLIASFFIQLLGLASPLFFQVVVDKVLVHKGLSTLDVVCVALLVVSVFEVVLGLIRTYVFAHTTNRIDVELGAKLYRHLLGLPLAYFGARRVGDSVARVRELENIRQFLTSSALTVVLDLFFALLFLGLMAWYSTTLTLIVLASLPCYGLLSVLVTPVLRQRLDVKFARGAENQAFLVESVSGIETVKAMAVEPPFTRQWDQQLAAYVSAGFKAGNLNNIAGQLAQLINKLVTVLVLWFGARAVMQGKLSVGQLIAFNMLAGRVSAPVLRLSQLWQDFQQAGLSIRRLGDILNTSTEAPRQARAALPSVHGLITLDNVVFRYQPGSSEVLRGVSLQVRPGEVVGIVGRSGSGKSTLAKLMQRLYVPERGRVLIDGVDIALTDPAWLRRQIGVVLQENRLFSRSIRDNIALAEPGAPMEAVLRAAQLAGAHDFIVELPQGYDTIVGEQGASLSGGQRQRIAIARALLTNPRILILDEATSALDYESERILQTNMQAICQGRTVLVIAHRLTALRHCQRLFVIDKGELVEEGSAQELLTIDQGHYRRLFAQQEA